MFLPVACLKCGRLFQVPEAAAGTDVACPFCKQSTAALPVAAAPATPAPLSLDDSEPTPASRPATGHRSFLVTAAVAMVLGVISLAATLAYLRYGSGEIAPTSWSEFTPADRSCSIQLPGAPTEERLEATPADGIVRGLSLYATDGWYSRARVWFGWRDLDPAWVKQAKEDKDGAVTNPVLTGEMNRRKDQVRGTVTKEATVRFGPHLGLEAWMDTPRGKLIERYIAATDGPRPRLYFMGVEAKNATADGPAAQKLFGSFRIHKEP